MAEITEEKSPNGNVSDEQNEGARRCACCVRISKKFSTEHNPLPEEPSCLDTVKYAFLCPPHGIVATLITTFFVVITLWGVAWSILKEEALPGGNIFGLIILLILCMLAGKITEKIRLPGLLG